MQTDTHINIHKHIHTKLYRKKYLQKKKIYQNGDIRGEICLWALYGANTLQKL